MLWVELGVGVVSEMAGALRVGAWALTAALAALSGAAASGPECLLERFESGGVLPATGGVVTRLVGTMPGLPDGGLGLVKVRLSDGGGSTDCAVSAMDAVSVTFFVPGSSPFTPGARVSAELRVSGASKCSLAASRYAFAAPAYSITGFGSSSGKLVSNSTYNAVGKQSIVITGSGIFDSGAPGTVLVRWRDAGGAPIGLEHVPAAVVRLGGAAVSNASASAFGVSVTSMAIPTPEDWLLSCASPARPVKGGRCVPDIATKLSLSLDGGLSWTPALDMVFGYQRPLRVAFLFNGPVDDFGWTYQMNAGRAALESQFGATIDASTYVENVPEGEHEIAQQDIGSTIAKGTPVPQFVDDGQGGQRANAYYIGLSWMKKWCDEDFDLVVTGSFGFQSQAVDVTTSYAGCTKAGNGSAPGAAEQPTFFMNTGGYLTTPLLAEGFVKIEQLRYLAGMVAGYEFKQQHEALVLAGKYNASESLCVGYIVAIPIPETQRGLNNFLLGCRSVYPDCVVKALFTGNWNAPELDTRAAAFLWNVGKCGILTQHSDATKEPQSYYKDKGGLGLGYNSDVRQLLGDSILMSIMIDWAPVVAYFVREVLDGSWDPASKDPARGGHAFLQEQIWLGQDDEAMKLSQYFSPRVAPAAQQAVLAEQERLRTLKGNDALKNYMCGPLRTRWRYARSNSNGTGPCSTNVAGQPNWRREPAAGKINPKHFLSGTTGSNLGATDTPAADDCLWGVRWPGEALLVTAFPDPFAEDDVFSDFLLEGIELFEPMVTPYGTIFGADNNPGFTEWGLSGDRYFYPPTVYPACDGSQFNYTRGECNPETMRSPVVYSWVNDSATRKLKYCGLVKDVAGEYTTRAELPELAEGPPCDYVATSSSAGSLVYAFVAIGVVVNAAIVLAIFHHRRHPSVRASQPNLVIAMGIGAVLLNLSSLFFIGQPSEATCKARIVTFNLAFDLVFSFLWSRIYRVNQLFSSNRKLKRIKVSDGDMVKAALAITVLDAIIITAWCLADPPLPRDTRTVLITLPAPGLGRLGYTECVSNATSFSAATLMFKCMLVLTACYLVFASKNVPSTYVEHKFIIFSAYNTAIFSGVVLLLTSNSNDNPKTAAIIQAAGVAFGSTIVVGSLALPRLLIATGRMADPAASVTGANSSLATSSGAATVPMDSSAVTAASASDE